MFKLKCICLLVIFAVAFGNNFTEKKKFFHFIRTQHGIPDFKFEYVTDNGQQISGKAVAVSRSEPSLYMMQGRDAPYYWVKFTENELNNEDDFDKIVRSVKLVRSGDVVAQLKDDFVSYEIHSNGQLTGGKYEADWDLDNISFELADTQTRQFYYAISSKNNGREFRGTTSYLSDPHVQTVSVPDRHECYVYQATFTDNELSVLGGTIYRYVQQNLKCSPPQESIPLVTLKEIDPSLLRSIVGAQSG
ncbi:uncharacterized protein LOC116347262 [Contarinia nasturtii]|uniref:uncharacterized protein LOC116347262 n=1 Tax=Contarinia nasturtii TaxID=265458 RepID=UPI0012D47997|nr:uncharacterized protein LOC116347262 [Contarinia nasturtii]